MIGLKFLHFLLDMISYSYTSVLISANTNTSVGLNFLLKLHLSWSPPFLILGNNV
ncbi:hypothetical protein I3843_15G065400 [Carya illinoinensis]|uniref:Uncharacterized protein n=1 Tax=Carya illinoinensis TaxID=32201 RepID=A0A922AA16_CARIL|nr:hypothetical protein I3760_15G067300 [Carya illinoinensis]KAG6674856.1 hypothetical protein I3842_15G067900 [Carya illinoinensis]KAG7943836.1 hypothetical protein I3843_15G065400 [Carya illinoinensis]